MERRRLLRLNSLLTEVISETIQREVKDPRVGAFVSVARVEISADLHHAKVYISVIGSDVEKKKSVEALNAAAGFVAVNSSKKVRLRHFPSLRFILDDSVDKLMHVEELLRQVRPHEDSVAMDAEDSNQ